VLDEYNTTGLMVLNIYIDNDTVRSMNLKFLNPNERGNAFDGWENYV
jgi:hypothetical protein